MPRLLHVDVAGHVLRDRADLAAGLHLVLAQPDPRRDGRQLALLHPQPEETREVEGKTL